jgi:signal transduction histidine kinase
MKLFGFTKLSAKLLALYLVLIGVTLVGLFSALETRDYFAQRRSLVVNLQELIKTQSVPIATALWELDTKKINTFLEEVEKLQFVRGAVITDSTGKIVAKNGDIDTPPKSSDFVAQEPLVFRSGANPQTLGSIKIIVHDQEILRTVKNRLVNDAIILLVLLAVLTGGTIFATNVIVGRPLTLLQASIEKIRRDGVRERVDWVASDELGQVVSAYNEMQSVQEDTEDALRRARDNLELRVKERTKELTHARDLAESALTDLKRTQRQLVHSQKMASLGILTAGIAHEIKNPLNLVNNFSRVSVELFDELRDAIEPARQALDDERRDELDDLVTTLAANMIRIDEQGRRADSIVKSMLQHSRDEASERHLTDINAFLEENLNLAYHGARARDQEFNITLERDFDPDAGSISIAAQDISRVLLNLFDNGFYATRQRQHLESSADYTPILGVISRDCGDSVQIRVRDNGTGIAGDIVNKIFDPFFTTKPTGEGTGLGLSLSHDIVVSQHGGSIEVSSAKGEFAEFTITLPRQSPPVVTKTSEID